MSRKLSQLTEIPGDVATGVRLLRQEGYGRFVDELSDYLVHIEKRREKRRIRENYQDDPKYLNVGGGQFVRDHWRVLDYPKDHYDYDDLFIDFEIDLEETETQWPMADNSYDLIYSSATLEHISSQAVDHSLEEAYRILKPGGGIHITVPDADLLLNIYENRDTEWIEKVAEVQPGGNDYMHCPLGYEPEFYVMVRIATALTLRTVDAGLDFDVVRSDYETMEKEEFLNKYTSMVREEWQQKIGGHRNWFNHDKLKRLLTRAGFTDVERTYARQSRYAELCVEGFDPRPQWSVHVDAGKPE